MSFIIPPKCDVRTPALTSLGQTKLPQGTKREKSLDQLWSTFYTLIPHSFGRQRPPMYVALFLWLYSALVHSSFSALPPL